MELMQIFTGGMRIQHRIIINLSKDYAGNTVDNPIKETCKAVGEKVRKIEERRREAEEKESMVFKKWFKKMEITLEEAHRTFLKEMEELHENELRKKLPPKLPDPGRF
ncbi:hypothetical protein A2U01_0065231, partial [Trifolium medium]|nr:hypothetical protein [Trifolium medium]